MTFLNAFYSFVFYSFFGWLIESTFVSLSEKHFVNRGFLDGPFCPIYGSGALAVILFVFPLKSNFLLFVIMSILITSLIEYLTSFFFEKVFNMVWWDYSDKPFNLHGRICLENSFYWGVLSILALDTIHPRILPLINFLSNYLSFYGVVIFVIYFIIDATDTFSVLFSFKKIISKKITDNNKKIHKKITRLINSFPDFRSQINNDFISELKSKLKIRKLI